MGVGAPDPTMAMAPPQGGAGGGQGVQIIQQIQDLLNQLAQAEPDPGVQRAVSSVGQLMDTLMQAVGSSDTQNMTSGVANPTGAPEGSPAEEAGESPAVEAAEQKSGGSKSFGGAKKAAMANFASKGHFSKSGSKGEQLQTDKQKNRK